MFRMWAFNKRNWFPLANIKVYIDLIHKKKYTIIIYFCIFFRRFTQETLLQRLVSPWNVCRQRSRVVRMFARLTVQLPPKPCCFVLWKRCFTTITCAWWNLTSSILKKSEAKFKRKTRKHRQLLSETRFILRIAPSSLSRDGKIKMKKKSHQRKSNA